MESRIKFVSYDGDYPNLCSGTLVLKVDGTVWTFEPHSLHSGGCASFDKHWNSYIRKGPWSIDTWPDGFPEGMEEEALDIINENIPHGCCGGCL